MTRHSLNRTLRATYVGLVLVLIIAFGAKVVAEAPALAGGGYNRLASNVYDFLRDMALVLVTVVAAYLANVFQKRSKFIESLEEEWRGIVSTKSELYRFCEKPNASIDDYLTAFCRLSETIDNMRIVYRNVGETDGLVGLYPYYPLHDMRRALQSIDPRKRQNVAPDERKLVRDSILQSFYALRERFLEELDLEEPAKPLVAVAARRLKGDGATSKALYLEREQEQRYEKAAAPRRTDIDTLLQRLREDERVQRVSEAQAREAEV